jgi:hypothetical protein
MDNNVNPIWYTRAVLYLLAFAAVGLGGFLTFSLIRLDRQEQARVEATEPPFVQCNFTNTGQDSIDLYSAPFIADALAIDTVPISVPLPVRMIHAPTGLLYIELRANYGGYVDPFQGLATGNCGAEFVPRDEQPVETFPTTCVLTVTQSGPLYQSPDQQQETGNNADTGDTWIVLRQTDDLYFIGDVNGGRGWVPAQTGQTSGACGALPG